MLLAGNLPDKRLDGTQKQRFRKALDATFGIDNFDQMLRDNLDKKVEDIIIPRNLGFPDVLDKVIERAEQENWTAELLQAALSRRPNDTQLITFAQQFGPVITTPPLKDLVPKLAGFERAITPVPMYDLDLLIQRLYKLAGQICCIEDAGGNHLGTGFLVGSDMIMTCYHVWEAAKAPNNFICRFNQGLTSENTNYRLAEKRYEINLSLYNPKEGQSNVPPSLDELDYALLRLADAPGNELIRHSFQKDSAQRGWITPYSQEYPFPPNTPLYILHYPQTDSLSHVTLKISLETYAIVELNENKTRVRYRTNTANGSSGAPCFNASWELVALHHLGDPNDHPKYNQGVPFTAIKKLLEQRDHKGIFINSTPSGASNNKGHEAPENTQSASYSYNQVSSPPEEQLYPTYLETDVSKSSSINQEPIKDESPNDSSKESSSDEGASYKIIDISTLRGQREARGIVSNRSFVQRARQHFKDAQKFVDDAYAPFAEGTCPAREESIDAIALLKKAKQSIQFLHALLFSGSSISDAILENRTLIDHYINTIIEQIEKHLLPSLNKNQLANFSLLQRAMQKINKLLPEQNNL